jgi:2-oxoglutarate ferredoxin oxidoreductase subunit beta
MPDGSSIYLKKLEQDYDPTNRERALDAIHEAHREGKLVTGLLYVDPDDVPFDDEMKLVDEPLASLPLERVRPPRVVLDEIVESLRTGRGVGAAGGG